MTIHGINNYIEQKLDQLTIRRKLVILYVFCVIVPLLLCDGLIFAALAKQESNSRRHEMENAANAVHSSFFSVIDGAARLGKGVYSSRYVNEFINRQFTSNLDYVERYNDFFNDTLISLVAGQNGSSYTFYLDNDTILNGHEFQKLERAQDTEWYQYMLDSGLNNGILFSYGPAADGTRGKERKIYYFQRLNYFKNDSKNVLLIEVDYGSTVRLLRNLNYSTEVYLCDENRVLISNGRFSNVKTVYSDLDSIKDYSYEDDIFVYGKELCLKVEGSTGIVAAIFKSWWYIFFLILAVTVLLPIYLMNEINKSFVIRVQELSDAFDRVDDKLMPLYFPRGNDEIGSLMHNYNRMTKRINDLIQTVYKNTIIEQEMLMARQNAELLALHSQINPHFLFNALESIRMHSLLKQETETAEMVENLAKMQRQYTEWQQDQVQIEKELEFVSAYLELQKYRFGDRLSFSLEVDEDCKALYLPKLSLVTFVENACVHGIESKTTPGWIFLRVNRDGEMLEIEIEDTGSGMEEEIRVELLERMKHCRMEMLMDKGRVGIINACLRLKMVSKETVTFDIDSESGVGTIVQIRIPISYLKGNE